MKKRLEKMIKKGEIADLYGADLSEVDLRGADLREVNLRKADLYGADLRDTDLRGADLSDSDLSDTDLRGSDLRNTDLRGADLYMSDLRGADLRYTKLPENIYCFRLDKYRGYIVAPEDDGALWMRFSCEEGMLFWWTENLEELCDRHEYGLATYFEEQISRHIEFAQRLLGA